MTGLPANTDYSNKGMKQLIKNFKNGKSKNDRFCCNSFYVCCIWKAEMYAESGTNMWDVAAGIAIVEAAE